MNIFASDTASTSPLAAANAPATATRDDEKPQSNTTPHPLDDILKNEPIAPPRMNEIVEGPIIARGTAEIFVDLGTRGTGIIFGREFFLAQDVFRKKHIGDIVNAKVVDPENNEGYVELSVSAAGREIAWEDLRHAYETKETIEVIVDSANRGGLVATVQNIKAFLPVSHLTPEHYPHVEGGDKERILEALRKFIGQKLKVKIINLDIAQDKLILSERAVMEEELREELKNFRVGDTVDATISGIVDFGLFLRFGPDEKLEGLAHISELSWEKIENIRERFTPGQNVKAKIIDIQGDRVALSLKALTPQPKHEEIPSSDEVQPETTAVSEPNLTGEPATTADAHPTPVSEEEQIAAFETPAEIAVAETPTNSPNEEPSAPVTEEAPPPETP